MNIFRGCQAMLFLITQYACFLFPRRKTGMLGWMCFPPEWDVFGKYQKLYYIHKKSNILTVPVIDLPQHFITRKSFMVDFMNVIGISATFILYLTSSKSMADLITFNQISCTSLINVVIGLQRTA